VEFLVNNDLVNRLVDLHAFQASGNKILSQLKNLWTEDKKAAAAAGEEFKSKSYDEDLGQNIWDGKTSLAANWPCIRAYLAGPVVRSQLWNSSTLSSGAYSPTRTSSR
jgi:hypothetical protein